MDTEARERIIVTALRLFADRGSAAVSIRDIASAAEVSPALIPHHFGSKAGMIDAVDAHVVGVFDGLQEALTHPDQPTAPEAGSAPHVQGMTTVMATYLPAASPILPYLRRALLDGSQTGRRIFRQWFEMTSGLLTQMEQAGALRTTADPEARAAFLLANDLSLLLLHDQIGDAIGTDPLTEPGTTRITTEAVRAYTDGIFIDPDLKEHP